VVTVANESVTLEFELHCKECGDVLKGEVIVQSKYPYGTVVEVVPCPKCLESAEDEARRNVE
jgi:hypothetical protein